MPRPCRRSNVRSPIFGSRDSRDPRRRVVRTSGRSGVLLLRYGWVECGVLGCPLG